MTIDDSNPFRPRRRWRWKSALAVLVILIIWQGSVKRPTPMARGTEFVSLGGFTPVNSGPNLRVAALNISGGVLPSDLRRFDVVGLEEVQGASLNHWLDQVTELGAALNMPSLFAPSEKVWWHDSFGNGALCSLPVTSWDRYPLATSLSVNNRTLLHLNLQWHDHPLAVLITQLDRNDDHDVRLGAILAAFYNAPKPVILMGELNSDASDKQLTALRNDPAVTDVLAGQTLPVDVNWIFSRGLQSVTGGLKNVGSSHQLAWAELAEPKQ
jgi:hypothetical protein